MQTATKKTTIESAEDLTDNQWLEETYGFTIEEPTPKDNLVNIGVCLFFIALTALAIYVMATLPQLPN